MLIIHNIWGWLGSPQKKDQSQIRTGSRLERRRLVLTSPPGRSIQLLTSLNIFSTRGILISGMMLAMIAFCIKNPKLSSCDLGMLMVMMIYNYVGGEG